MSTPISPLPARRQMSFIVFSVALLVVALVVVLTLYAASQGPEKKPTNQMPDVQDKGLQYAVEQTHTEYSRNVDVYDATGRHRRLGDKREWEVCFQQPAPGTQNAGQQVRLYGVHTDESCSSLVDAVTLEPKNYGYLPAVYDQPDQQGTHVVPDLFNYTPYMARQAFGDIASILNTDPSASPSPTPTDLGNRVVQVVDKAGRLVFGGDGDYRICKQEPAPMTPWTGQVVRLTVVAYDDKC